MVDYRNYQAWSVSMDLCDAVYESTSLFPRHEIFGLTQQVRKASVSVVSNIAEGAGRSTDADFARHLSYALGSINEVECQMLIARRRNYISEKTLHNVEQLVRSSRRLTTRLRQSVADSS